MRRISKVIIAFTLLAGILMVAFALIIFPTAEEEELETATVTLGTYRYEVVGFKPRRRGSRVIKAMIFHASDGQQYQVAMFYKDEAEELSERTVTVRYIKDGGDYFGTNLIVEMAEGDKTHYTLADWNQRQRASVWGTLLLWGLFAFVAFMYVWDDVCGIFSRANRHRRRARKKAARAERLDNLANRPHNFPGSVWKSTNGRLTLTVDEDGGITGVIGVLDKDGDVMSSVSVSFDDTAHTTIRIAPLEAGERVGPYIEIWEGDYDYPDRFTAKPVKTTYFKKGKTLTVRRKDGEGL